MDKRRNDDPLAHRPCRDCGEFQLRTEFRKCLIARRLGTHSLSGTQLKTSGIEVDWPWAVCDGCGAEYEGKTS